MTVYNTKSDYVTINCGVDLSVLSLLLTFIDYSGTEKVVLDGHYTAILNDSESYLPYIVVSYTRDSIPGTRVVNLIDHLTTNNEKLLNAVVESDTFLQYYYFSMVSLSAEYIKLLILDISIEGVKLKHKSHSSFQEYCNIYHIVVYKYKKDDLDYIFTLTCCIELQFYLGVIY